MGNACELSGGVPEPKTKEQTRAELDILWFTSLDGVERQHGFTGIRAGLAGLNVRAFVHAVPFDQVDTPRGIEIDLRVVETLGRGVRRIQSSALRVPGAVAPPVVRTSANLRHLVQRGGWISTEDWEFGCNRGLRKCEVKNQKRWSFFSCRKG
jgi:hypothetical protein